MPETVYHIRRFDGSCVVDGNELEFAMRQCPQDRYVTWEPKDMEWLIPLGMAPERILSRQQIDELVQKLHSEIEIALFYGNGTGSITL